MHNGKHHALRRALYAVCIPLLLCSGCASSPLAKTPGTGDASPAANKQTPVYFKTRSGHPVSVPLIHVTIAGQPATVILDTGSPFNIIDTRLTKQLGLATSSKRGRGLDAIGQPIHYKRVKAPQTEIQGWGPHDDTPVMTTPLPKLFRKLNLAGLMAPWWLTAPDQALVLNFQDKQLAIMPMSKAKQVFEKHLGRTMLIKAFRKKSGAMSYTIPVQIDGHDTRLLIDTGSTGTYIYANSNIASKLDRPTETTTSSITVASGQAQYQVLNDVPVKLGHIRENTKILVMKGKQETHKHFDGILGMHFLRWCILALTPKGGAALCR